MKTEYPESTLIGIYSIRRRPDKTLWPLPFEVREGNSGDKGAWLIDVDGDDHWHPANELEGVPGAPDPLVAPNLPIPFTAAQLAAFMVDGVGSIIPALFGGTWADGPDATALEALGPKGASPREAIRAAYAAIREAEDAVRGPAVEALRQARVLRSEYLEKLEAALGHEQSATDAACGEERAIASVGHLLNEVQAAEASASDLFPQWRRAIVRHLWASAIHDAPILQAVLDSAAAPASDGSASEGPMDGLDERPPLSPDTLQGIIDGAETKEHLPDSEQASASGQVVMKKQAMVDKHLGTWGSIDADMKDGYRNGLSKAARASGGRGWYEERALAWARANGKLRETPDQGPAPLSQALHSLANLPVRRHRL